MEAVVICKSCGKDPEADRTGPSLDEVKEFAKGRGLVVDPKRFWDYYEAKQWSSPIKGPIQDWKDVMLAWDHGDRKKQAPLVEEPF